MKNIIFISPNFPTNYWKFCQELKNNGMNVLGIGDAFYDELTPELKNCLTEYYKVDSMEDYDEMYRAVAFFAFKYGRIDWIESNNEYWLENDAKLRTDFNIKSGFQEKDLPRIKYKSKMKTYYTKAGVPVARYHIVDNLKGCQKFISEVGYPVIVKPDNGVGASHTYKLKTEDELKAFLEEKEEGVSYIMEEFIDAEINSYDAIFNSRGEPIFEVGNVTPISIMDSVNEGDDAIFYIVKDLADDVREKGRATAKAFGVKNRFVHFEFFRLLSDQHIGKKGDVVALEVNMRPCGGFTPDMINFSRETDVYKIWADMIAFGHSEKEVGAHHYSAFIGLRDYKVYEMSHEDIMEKYGASIKMADRLPDALSAAMGNRIYMATFDTKEEMDVFYKELLELKKTDK